MEIRQRLHWKRCSKLQVRMSKLEVRIVMRWVSTYSTQNTFPAFVDSEKFRIGIWESEDFMNRGLVTMVWSAGVSRTRLVLSVAR